MIDIKKLRELAERASAETRVDVHDKLVDLFRRRLADDWPEICRELEDGQKARRITYCPHTQHIEDLEREAEAGRKLAKAVAAMNMNDLPLANVGSAMNAMREGGNRMNECWRNQRDEALVAYQKAMKV